jgi:hypothetical protein
LGLQQQLLQQDKLGVNMAITANATTLTFNDATTQTTSGVTAVNVSTGISSSGGKTPTLTNTGVTSLTAGTGITVSASTGGVTITNSSPGAVSSVNGATGAVVTTTAGNIGCTQLCVYAQTGTSSLNTALYLTYDTTVAGSTLRYGVTNQRTSIDAANSVLQRAGIPHGSSPTYTASGGTTPSGTWRLLDSNQWFYNQNTSNDPAEYSANWIFQLWVRIS